MKSAWTRRLCPKAAGVAHMFEVETGLDLRKVKVGQYLQTGQQSSPKIVRLLGTMDPSISH